MSDTIAPAPVDQRTLDPRQFLNPAILLAGPVDYAMYQTFRQRLEGAPAQGTIVVELSTLGAIVVELSTLG
ncbi:hypothetical protein VF09_37095, partial [Nostoc linckia z9]